MSPCETYLPGLTMTEGRGSQSAVLEPAASASPGNLLEMKILRPTPDLLNQTLGFNSPTAILMLTNF